MPKKERPYSLEKQEQITEQYLEMFGELPRTPIGFSIGLILDLMEKAIERKVPLKWEEYENRFHYRKGVTY